MHAQARMEAAAQAHHLKNAPHYGKILQQISNSPILQTGTLILHRTHFDIYLFSVACVRADGEHAHQVVAQTQQLEAEAQGHAQAQSQLVVHAHNLTAKAHAHANAQVIPFQDSFSRLL